MLTPVRLFILFFIKALSMLFYRVDLKWINQRPKNPWSDVKLLILLNHTTLYEPVFFSSVPNKVLLQVAQRGVFPGAAETLERPFVGRFFKMIAPYAIPISRKRDDTWANFLDHIHKQSMVLFIPEGRMKRPSGLDKNGKPMTVRGGIADLLRMVGKGRMMIAYSGGLHHVQAPGEALPHVFKDVKLGLELVDIESYIERMGHADDNNEFRNAVTKDLEVRRDLVVAAINDPKYKRRKIIPLELA